MSSLANQQRSKRFWRQWSYRPGVTATRLVSDDIIM